MPTYQMVPVADLEPPLNPQREETLYERIDELRDSIRTNGLQQPVGVEQVETSRYRIIWGHRRSIACTQLGWTHIGAMVYRPGEADADALMGAENYHRAQTSDAEEARYYARILSKYPEGTIGMARELNVPQSRIERLLLCLDGDPAVFEWMAKGKLTLAQAYEINKFKSPGYRLQATERCLVDQLGSETLRRWRQDVQKQGLDHYAAEQQVTWATPHQPVGKIPEANCMIGNHMVPMLDRKIYEICHNHYNIFLEGLEHMGRCETIREAGLWPQFMALLREAERVNEHGGGTVQPRDDSGS